MRLYSYLANGGVKAGAERDGRLAPLPFASIFALIQGGAESLSAAATAFTLRPGDIVSTGTPAGTGCFRDPQVFLRPGDTCRPEIDRIGVLENTVVEMPALHSEWESPREMAC